MTETMQSVTFDAPRRVEPEDQARADFYALLANLLYRPPTGPLLTAIGVAEPPGGALCAPWEALAAAATVVSEEAVREEYEALFIGVGRPPVMLYGSFYLAGFMMEKPLAELRDALAQMGFRRLSNVNEPEDHLAALCDVMRAMILGNIAAPPQSFAAQKNFFDVHIAPWVFNCTSAISAYHQSNFYQRVAQFAQAFFEVEAETFKQFN